MFTDALLDFLRYGIGPTLAGAGPFLRAFGTMFLSVLLGALPFILLAVLASGFVELFVSRQALARVLPKNPLLGVLVAPLVGFFIPLCECAIIPVAARLVRKGVPLAVGISFMLANPIFNPVPLYSTAMAFPFHPEMVVLRMGAGYLYAVLIGLVILVAVRGNHLRGIPLTQYATGLRSDEPDERELYRRAAQSYHRRRLSDAAPVAGAAGGGAVVATAAPAYAAPGVAVPAGGFTGRMGWSAALAARLDATDPASIALPFTRRLRLALEHAGVEFFVVGKFFIIGAFLASLVQATISRSTLAAVGQGETGSVVAMMGLAYALNICSEADAFVAAGFTASFNLGALLAFLTLGPMTDVKNTLMMFATFRRPFAILLNILIILTVFAGGVLVNRWLY